MVVEVINLCTIILDIIRTEKEEGKEEEEVRGQRIQKKNLNY